MSIFKHDIHDSCTCGSVFHCAGFPQNVYDTWKDWAAQHRKCRGK